MHADWALLSQLPDVVPTAKGNSTREKKKNQRDYAHILRHSLIHALWSTTLELQSSACFLGEQGKEKKNKKES